jgi:hypothetical protein
MAAQPKKDAQTAVRIRSILVSFIVEGSCTAWYEMFEGTLSPFLILE